MSRLIPRHLLFSGAVSGLALLIAQPSFAQQANETKLAPIVVDGGGARAGTGDSAVEVKGVAAKKSRTGAKTATDLKEIPQSVSVVGRDQIEMQSPQKMDEALRYTPGVNPSTYGTDSDTDWIFVRGFQADQTGVFLDGLPFYQTGFGTFLMDPFFVERIDVIKGPSSALYGGGNPGGYINYVSKRPGEQHRYAEAGVNSFGNGYVAADIGDRLTDVFSYRVNAKVSGGGWETDHSEDLRGAIAPSFKWSPDESTSLTVLASLSRTDLVHTSSGFLPYYGTVRATDDGVRIPRDFFYGEKDLEQYDRTQAMIGYEFSHTFDNDWTVRQNLRFAKVSLEEDGLYGAGNLTGSMLPRFRFGHDTDVNTFTVDNQLEGKLATGGLDHTLLMGVDYRYYAIDQTQASAFPAGSIDVLNPVYGLPQPDLPTPYIDSDTTLNQVGLYAQDQVRFGNGWLATLNGRYDFVTRDLDDRLEDKVTKSDDGAFSGRVGLAYEFANGVTPYASYSTSFSPPTTLDSDNALLKPETAQQWEAGVKYAPTWFDGMFTAAIFDLKRQNVAGPTETIPVRTEAVGEVRMRGVELSAQANLTNELKLLGGLTYLDGEVTKSIGGAFDGTSVGKTPIQIPDLTASLWLDYTFQSGNLEGFGFGAGVRYVGESWADRANTLKVPEVALVDAAIRYDRDNWGIALNGSNLFDTTYVASCQGLTSCGYGAGRTFTLKAHVNW